MTIKNYLYLRFKLLFLAIFIIVGIFISSFCFASILDDDFESYNLGQLNGQGNWTCNSPAVVNVIDSLPRSGEKSVKSTEASGINVNINNIENMTGGIFSYYFYLTKTTNDQYWNNVFYNTSVQTLFRGGYISCDGSICMVKWDDGQGNYYQIGEVSINQWHYLAFDFDFIEGTFRYKLDNNDWSEEGETLTTGTLDMIYIYFGSNVYVDDYGIEYEAPEPYIEATSPAGASTITDLDDQITINYYYIDPDIYDGFVLNFKQDIIGIVGSSYEFDSISASGTGTFNLPLSTFEIDENGKWYLEGLAFYTHLDIEGGMFLTTRGYIEEYTDNLVINNYYLLFNVGGLPESYTFTDANDWYSTNVLRFDSSTEMFTAFVDLITPIFRNIAEFGVRVQNMFDLDEAYDKGYALGEVFPIARSYIEKIDMFFGGFPLASFFMYIILIMMAIFIIRIVMKFIPFFG